MPDYTDDWMNPQMSRSYKIDTERELTPFLIQREAAVICSFVGGRRPTEWKHWSSHKTREERDAELKKLREDHPSWRLRPAYEHERYGGREVEVEDETADLLMRLARLKTRGRSSAKA